GRPAGHSTTPENIRLGGRVLSVLLLGVQPSLECPFHLRHELILTAMLRVVPHHVEHLVKSLTLNETQLSGDAFKCSTITIGHGEWSVDEVVESLDVALCDRGHGVLPLVVCSSLAYVLP